MKPLISIVISSYNRADKLQKALQGIENQQSVQPDDFEVLIVDNNSTDDSEAVALSFDSEMNLRFVIEETQGLGHVRNTGFLLAQGEYVAYLDDDAIPPPTWISGILKIISSQSPDCICGPYYPYYDTEKPTWFLDEYEIRTKGDKQRLLVPGEECSGSNMIWKKEVLELLGGVDVSLGMKGEYIVGGEDSDLFRRYWLKAGTPPLNGRIVYNPDLEILHWTPGYKMRVNYILKRNYAAGIAAARMRRDDSHLKKAATSLRLFLEMGFVLFRFPFMRFRYTHRENWIVEEIRRLYFRAGWILTYLGFSSHPSV
jgi:glycosyltransferase involved in cell wall biosynthesis